LWLGDWRHGATEDILEETTISSDVNSETRITHEREHAESVRVSRRLLDIVVVQTKEGWSAKVQE
jgi:hypothetical protein